MTPVMDGTGVWKVGTPQNAESRLQPSMRGSHGNGGCATDATAECCGAVAPGETPKRNSGTRWGARASGRSVAVVAVVVAPKRNDRVGHTPPLGGVPPRCAVR